MARQRTSAKTARWYAALAGVDPDEVSHALVRGGTHHRVDLLLLDGRQVSYHPSDRVTAGEVVSWYPEPWFSVHTR